MAKIENHYQKGMSVMNYLKRLNTSWITIGRAIQDSMLEKSYQLITENPKITKEEFLMKMNIEEEED